MRYCVFLSFILLQGRFDAQPVVKIPAVIGDHMVVECNMHDSIWGWADPGEQVAVSLGNQEKTTRAGADGQRRIFLDPMPAGGPFEMRIAGKNSITLLGLERLRLISATARGLAEEPGRLVLILEGEPKALRNYYPRPARLKTFTH